MVQSYALVPERAPFVALAFLLTAGAIGVALLGAAVSAACRRRRTALALVAAGGAIGGGYALLLISLSVVSRDVRLPPGGRKYFCEIDCHIAYSVVGASRIPGGNIAVDVSAWFDPATTALRRGDALLVPNPREALLVDSGGRRYRPLSAGNGFSKPLRPGESYVVRLVFPPLPGGDGWRLWIGDPPGMETLFLSHENSPLHGKIYLDVPLPPPVSARSGDLAPAGTAGRKCGRELAPSLAHDASEVGRIQRGRAHRQRPLLPGDLPRALPVLPAPALQARSRARARLRLLRRRLRGHLPGGRARAATSRQTLGEMDVVRR
jgi:hypothetical protein